MGYEYISLQISISEIQRLTNEYVCKENECYNLSDTEGSFALTSRSFRFLFLLYAIMGLLERGEDILGTSEDFDIPVKGRLANWVHIGKQMELLGL